MQTTTPSGDVYATQEQLNRLEELLTKNQATLAEIQSHKYFLNSDLRNSIEEQLEEALQQRGNFGQNYANITKFITKQIALAVAQIQETNTKLLQDTIPIKALQNLEKRLYTKATATDDLQSLAARISILETTKQPLVPQEKRADETSGELDALKEKVSQLETNLLNEVQKAYNTVYKPGEYAAPLVKLQSQVNILQEDVSRLRMVDGQTIAEKLITTNGTLMKTDLQMQLNTKASKEDLETMQHTLNRIEQFSREVQTGFYSMRTQHQKTTETLTTAWNLFQEKIQKNVDDEMRKRDDDADTYRKNLELALESAVNQIKEVELNAKIQQTEMFANLQKFVKAQQTEFSDAVNQKISALQDAADNEIQSIKKTVSNFLEETRREVSASRLNAKYSEFQNKLDAQTDAVQALMAKLERTEQKLVSAEQSIQFKKEAVWNRVQEAENQIKLLNSSMQDTKKALKEEMEVWIKEKHIAAQESYNDLMKEMQSVYDSLLIIKGDFQKEVFEFKSRPNFEDKFDKWFQEKDEYILQRTLDFQGKIKQALSDISKKEQELNTMFSEETLVNYLAECEHRLKKTQEEWTRRRTEEFHQRYEKMTNQVANAMNRYQEIEVVYKDFNSLYGKESFERIVNKIEKEFYQKYDDWVLTYEDKTQKMNSHFNKELEKWTAIARRAEERESRIAKAYGEEAFKKYVKECETSLRESFNEIMVGYEGVLPQQNTNNVNNEKVIQMIADSETRLRNHLNLYSKKHEEYIHKQSQNAQEEALKTVNAYIKKIDENYKLKTITINENLEKCIALANTIEKQEKTLLEFCGEDRLGALVNQCENNLGDRLDKWMKEQRSTNASYQTALKKEIQDKQTMFERDIYNFKRAYEEWKDAKITEINDMLEPLKKDILKSYQNLEDYDAKIKKLIQEWYTYIPKELKETLIKEINDKVTLIKYSIDDKFTNFKTTVESDIALMQEYSKQLQTTTKQDTVNIRNEMLDKVKMIKYNIDDKFVHFKNTIGIDIERVDTYMQECEKQIRLINKQLSVNAKNELNYTGISKCFYTAVFGENTLAPIQDRIEGWDYVCFTNLDMPETTGWTIVNVSLEDKNPVLEEKKYKWLSHSYLLDYDVVCWVDSCIAPSSLYSDMIKQWLINMINTDTGILHKLHESRDCAYEECDAVRAEDKVRFELKKENVPKHGGLVNTNIMIRMHKNRNVQDISEKIYDYLSTLTLYDQIIASLVYHKYNYSNFKKYDLMKAFEKTV